MDKAEKANLPSTRDWHTQASQRVWARMKKYNRLRTLHRRTGADAKKAGTLRLRGHSMTVPTATASRVLAGASLQLV
jgi:hypothetical protein